MIRYYDCFLPELRDLKTVLPIAIIETAIKVIMQHTKKEAIWEQNDCIESTIEVMEEISYESPTESEMRLIF